MTYVTERRFNEGSQRTIKIKQSDNKLGVHQGTQVQWTPPHIEINEVNVIIKQQIIKHHFFSQLEKDGECRVTQRTPPLQRNTEGVHAFTFVCNQESCKSRKETIERKTNDAKIHWSTVMITKRLK